MTRVKSIGVLSLAKITGLGYFAVGLILVPFFLLFGLAGLAAGRQAGGPQLPAAFGFVFAILAPFFYGGIGFVSGALGALIYNLLAGWIGGIELEFEMAAPVVQPYTPAAPPPPMQPVQP